MTIDKLKTPTRRAVLAAGGAAAAVTLFRPNIGRAALMPLKAVYPTRSTPSWPLYLAREGKYFEKYGLDVDVQYGGHPIAVAGIVSGEVHFTNYLLDNVVAGASRQQVFTIPACLLGKAIIGLMARPEITKVEELKGKRLGVERVGDPPYQFTTALLKDYGLTAQDVQWVPTGSDANARAQMIVAGQIDAAALSAPACYRLEAKGLRTLTMLEDHDNVIISSCLTFGKQWAAANAEVVTNIIKAVTEATQRFYEDKAFALETYGKYDAAGMDMAERLYNANKDKNIFYRVPMLSKAAVAATTDRLDGQVPNVRAFDYSQLVDQSAVKKLAQDGFFTKVFGAAVEKEQAERLKSAF